MDTDGIALPLIRLRSWRARQSGKHLEVDQAPYTRVGNVHQGRVARLLSCKFGTSRVNNAQVFASQSCCCLEWEESHFFGELNTAGTFRLFVSGDYE